MKKRCVTPVVLNQPPQQWNRTGRPLFRRAACIGITVFSLLFVRAGWGGEAASTWPQAYSVQRARARHLLTVRTPYYFFEHDLEHGGVLCRIRLVHGQATNLLIRPLATVIEDERSATFTDLQDRAPRVSYKQDGLYEFVTVQSRLRDGAGRDSGLQLKTLYEYRWGYVKIHKQFTTARSGFRARDLRVVDTILAPSLGHYGYRDGLTEQEGAPPFSFGSCHWGQLQFTPNSESAVKLRYLPRYWMFADPDVEGLEWFMGSELGQWDLQLTGSRGQGNCTVAPNLAPRGIDFSISAAQNLEHPISLPKTFAFDCYLGVPILEGHARPPWFHGSFNRNRGEWVSPEQVRRWADEGMQTVHCHNDGDYYDDGLFWRDGSYPPYPDMDKYNQVIGECHRAGIRVATYFSNKELHPSTREFQEHGTEWGRKDREGKLQHNFFRGTNEFGAQMCLRSAWLGFLKASIDRVLTNSPLNGVYYDWNVALFCRNGLHEGKQSGEIGYGHWDIDELLNLMEWTRRRVGPQGLIIVHNTTTPMFATENFADYVVANEWGYGKWTDKGPELKDLPLEWSLVGARARGVISYGQLNSEAPKRLHRLFALEALLGGVTPWPASPETFELDSALKPVGDFQTCRFADWRNQAVTLEGTRCASAVYSRPNEAFLLLGNLDSTPQRLRCVLHPERLPFALRAPTSASLVCQRPGPAADSGDPQPVALPQLLGEGLTVDVPAEGVTVLRVR